MSAGALDTPMMRQYQEAKQRHPGMVVLFRMGADPMALDADGIPPLFLAAACGFNDMRGMLRRVTSATDRSALWFRHPTTRATLAHAAAACQGTAGAFALNVLAKGQQPLASGAMRAASVPDRAGC